MNTEDEIKKATYPESIFKSFHKETGKFQNKSIIKDASVNILNDLYKTNPDFFNDIYASFREYLSSTYNYSNDIKTLEEFYRIVIATSKMSKPQGAYKPSPPYKHIPTKQRLANYTQRYKKLIGEVFNQAMNGQSKNLEIQVIPNKELHRINVETNKRTGWGERSRYSTIPITLTIPTCSLRNVERIFPQCSFMYRNKLRPVLFAEKVDNEVFHVIFIQIETYERMHHVEGYVKYVQQYDDWVYSARLCNLPASEKRYIAREVTKVVQNGF